MPAPLKFKLTEMTPEEFIEKFLTVDGQPLVLTPAQRLLMKTFKNDRERVRLKVDYYHRYPSTLDALRYAMLRGNGALKTTWEETPDAST